MSSNITKPTKTDVISFLQNISNEKRKADGFTILKMMKEITGLMPVLWGPSIIGFGSQHYKYESGREGDVPLLCFSPRKARQVLYVLSNFEGQDKLLEKLGKHKTGKVCLYINKLEDVDQEVLYKIMQRSWEDAVAKQKANKTDGYR